MSSTTLCFSQVYDWCNLVKASDQAARGKRGRQAVAQFETFWADHLLDLQTSLRDGSYCPGAYSSFYIHEPKRRKISAAPFRDRVVHHALCRIIEPWFEQRFIDDSFANRSGKGTHRAVDRFQQFSRRYRYTLRLDIVKHFPSIDHAVLLNEISRAPLDEGIFNLCTAIVASGKGVLDDESKAEYFSGDDLFATLRPRGLPIGNLTSQFWSNVYLNPLDQFIKRELRCPAYLRYVDDMALFGDSKPELWGWKLAIVERLQQLRLRVHSSSSQVTPTYAGTPWLGFVIFPEHRRIKARVGQKAARQIAKVWEEYRLGRATFAELDVIVKSWVNYLEYADTWNLRKDLLNVARL